uniref:helix-hairpin-helix domain-containing protein n=1 Tax=Herbidospora sakaeratensis TaxID=564415 RepID=UPI000782ABEE|nr:helix-hairpin-helix domain-containing protein [Herbidospora sakaeratensis]
MTVETTAVEQEFVIRALLEYEYKVKAADADEAANLMQDGERNLGSGQCVGYSIHSVVSAEAAKKTQTWSEDQDERTRCKCGHLVDESHIGRHKRDDQGRALLVKGRLVKDTDHPEACCEYRCDCVRPRPLTTLLADHIAASGLPGTTLISDLPGVTWHQSKPLADHGITTMSDLAARSKADLLEVPGFGDGRLAKLTAALDGAA